MDVLMLISYQDNKDFYYYIFPDEKPDDPIIVCDPNFTGNQ